jgi:ProP effector
MGLRKFLVYYTDRKPYLKAIVQEKWRYDLNGNMVEEITQDQKDYALKHLEFIKLIWLKIYLAKKLSKKKK